MLIWHLMTAAEVKLWPSTTITPTVCGDPKSKVQVFAPVAFAVRVATFRRAKEDMVTLAGFAKSEEWPKQQVRFLQEFLKENGIGEQ